MTDQEFRALALLCVITEYILAHGKPPVQKQLVVREDKGWGGLVNKWFDSSGARAEHPFGFSGGPRVHDAAQLLSDVGLMVPRGYIAHETAGDEDDDDDTTKNKRMSYRPTERGMALGKQLMETTWRMWKADWLKGA